MRRIGHVDRQQPEREAHRPGRVVVGVRRARHEGQHQQRDERIRDGSGDGDEVMAGGKADQLPFEPGSRDGTSCSRLSSRPNRATLMTSTSPTRPSTQAPRIAHALADAASATSRTALMAPNVAFSIGHPSGPAQTDQHGVLEREHDPETIDAANSRTVSGLSVRTPRPARRAKPTRKMPVATSAIAIAAA